MNPDEPPPDALCERCWGPCLPGEQAAQLGHIVGANRRGDVTWAYTYVHRSDGRGGCVRLEG